MNLIRIGTDIVNLNSVTCIEISVVKERKTAGSLGPPIGEQRSAIFHFVGGPSKSYDVSKEYPELYEWITEKVHTEKTFKKEK